MLHSILRGTKQNLKGNAKCGEQVVCFASKRSSFYVPIRQDHMFWYFITLLISWLFVSKFDRGVVLVEKPADSTLGTVIVESFSINFKDFYQL